MSLQPGFHRLYGDLLCFGLFLWKSQQCRDGDKGGNKGFGTLSACPQDRLIMLLISIGIFQDKLCFANATQATDGLRLRDSQSLTSLETRVKLSQQGFLSSEKRIARVGNIPNKR